MKPILILLMLAGAGCARFTQTQIELVEQARQGMQLCRAAAKERSALIEQYHQLQRARLDEAFAADVRGRKDLSPDWVLEHQKAYSAAVAALDRRRASSSESDAAAQRNFDAVEMALSRLLMLQNVQLKLSIDNLLSAGK